MSFVIPFPWHLLLGLVPYSPGTHTLTLVFFWCQHTYRSSFCFPPTPAPTSICVHVGDVSVFLLSSLSPLPPYIHFLTFWVFFWFSLEMLYLLSSYLQREFIMRLSACPVFFLDDCWGIFIFLQLEKYLALSK